MNRDIRTAGPLGRFWQAILETSEKAVSVHYEAPWAPRRRSPVTYGR